MRPDDLRDWLQVRPFAPFRIHVTNGVSFDVRHPDQAAVFRSTVNIAVPPSPGQPAGPEVRPVTVALIHITYLEPLPAPPPPSAN
jgi:hypothetical protein